MFMQIGLLTYNEALTLLLRAAISDPLLYVQALSASVYDAF